jgi:hypothetical protein
MSTNVGRSKLAGGPAACPCTDSSIANHNVCVHSCGVYISYVVATVLSHAAHTNFLAASETTVLLCDLRSIILLEM